MTLTARIKLINDMVRENPDTTIRDYLELVKEMKGIRKAANQVIVPVIVNPLPPKKRSVKRESGKYLQTYKLNFGR
jgi:hypothetical protein